MLVKYDGKNLKRLAYSTKMQGGQVSQAYGAIDLRPGMNEVKAAEWDKVKKDPEVAMLLEEGVLEVIEEKDGKADKVLPTLEKMAAAKAIKLVKATMDLSLLEIWTSGEKRETVLRALASQKQEIEDEAKKK